MLNNQYHREEDKPASITRFGDGTVKDMSFWKNGQLHRDPAIGLALIEYCENTKQPKSVDYRWEGKKIEFVQNKSNKNNFDL